MNGRIYDPLIGRFLSADPILQDPMNGQSYNRYTYVLNNPTNLTDPTGFETFGGCKDSGPNSFTCPLGIPNPDKKDEKPTSEDAAKSQQTTDSSGVDKENPKGTNRETLGKSASDIFREQARNFRELSQLDLPWYKTIFGDPREDWALLTRIEY